MIEIKKIIIIISIALCFMGLILLVPILMTLNYFGINETDNYIENNFEYAEQYKKVLNKNIKLGNGYVSLSRILYFYIEDNSLSFEEIYNDNLDVELKKQKNIYEVCELNKYKIMNVCNEDNISSSNQLKESINKPFTYPLEISNLNVTSFFMEERIVYGKFNVHEAWDFASPSKTQVYSVCDGEVENISFKYNTNTIDKSGGTGNTIVIKCELEDVTYHVLYGHLYPNSSMLNKGDIVFKKEPIASVGTTGYSTGSHLHFKVTKDNKSVDGVSLINFNEI